MESGPRPSAGVIFISSEGNIRRLPLPVAIGHELAGEVLRIGKEVSRVKEGDRVVVEPVIICGECTFCRRGGYQLCLNISFQYRAGQGAFTPYFVTRENWIHLLPRNVSFEEGALIEPLSVAIHAVKKGSLQLGHSVAIFGAGAIGLLVLILSRRSGAGEMFVVDVQGHRLKKAEELGGPLRVRSIMREETLLKRSSGRPLNWVWIDRSKPSGE